MRPRVLLAAALAPIVLGSCDVGPQHPVPTTAPTPPAKYDDVGAGICERLDLPSLVGAIGDPGQVKTEVVYLREAAYVCRLDVETDDPWYGAQVVVGVALGEDSPDSAEIFGRNDYVATEELEPISGWWSEGNEQVSTDPSDPGGATWVRVHTRVLDSNLYVNIDIVNPGVESDEERAATTGFGKAVLRRLHNELEPASQKE